MKIYGKNFSTAVSACLFVLLMPVCGGAVGGHAGRAQGGGAKQNSERSLSDIAGIGEQQIRRILSYNTELKLSPKQESSLVAIRTELIKNLAVVVKSYMQCQYEFFTVVEAENPDFKAIRDKAREMTTIETYVTALSVDAFDKAFAILDEKQKNMWAVLAKKRHEELRQQMMSQMNNPMMH
jgi:Spy/CpxP family protein refolding chaperone